ncbi:LOW QUALITY PROTEIN: histone-lysine N-methyltransferase 2A [Bufo bufo]|uniref:LOW QUALITY PROTEIN: histone-lysine N-methyltransferase 2A n=1 Tax=Bufo bufo TaxID=8384 RepID=UPI001ABED196|nr:LOW QUALITY PROTEIN: histone-lysine N-methyltransferase 2A [Bufo bufo]
MAHSCRWRFPARPGTGRRLGAKHRLAAVLREDVSVTGCSTGTAYGASLAPGGHGNCGVVGPGFDAALQVSIAIGSNLRRFRDVSGGSSGEEDHFLGFGPDDEVKTRSPTKSPSDQSTPRKPRGRPRSSLSRSSDASSTPADNRSPVTNKQDLRPADKAKKPERKPEEKRRGRPPAQGSVKFKMTQDKREVSEPVKTSREDKTKRRKQTAAFQHAAKIKKLRTVLLSPIKPKFKGEKLQIGRKAAVQIVKRRGRPPSSERFKPTPPEIMLRQSQGDKSQRGRKEESPQLLKDEARVSVRQSPRRIKPVRIIPTSKRTDTTIAKQLLQKAKKGAQKKMELEAAKLQGRKGGTQLKNIRQFIMPVVSTVSSRIIKTPRRFIEDEDYEPPIKIARLETAPIGRFSAASCESSEKSSAASQQSSQATSDESRSSSPSVDTSTESQASEETPAVTDPQECLTEMPVATPQSVPENRGGGARSRRMSNCNRSFNSRQTKKIISPPLQQSSASPPLLSPPAPHQPPSSLSEHSTWVIPPNIPLHPPFLSASRMHEKRRSILREPTFRWTSRPESQYFSSAKYAKEGLIRKPIFDNFRSPPLTAEDVGLASASGFSSASVVAPGRLFSQLHAAGRFDVPKRSPILRAPRFTPSEAHSRIFESVTLPSSVGRSGGASSIIGMASRRRKRRVFSPIRSSVSRSPSHSMRTRSRRESSSNVAASLIPQSSTSLAGISVSPLTASALNPSFHFSSTSTTPAPGDSAEKSQKPRKQASTPGEHFSSSSNSSAALFPLFPSSPQMDRGRNKGRISDEAPKERETERCREKDREKENSHDSRKDKRKKGSDAAKKSTKEKSDGEALTPATPIKLLSRKRTVMAEPSLATSLPALPAVPVPAKNKVSKKGRGISEKHDLETGAKSPPTEPHTAVPVQPVNPVKSSTTTIGSMLDKFLASKKHVASLLRTAKCQLQNIEKSKLRKPGEQPKAQGQESDSSETSVRGPRIKHVCRRAAVALGRKRAVFPDDMPTLSALPWEEREKVLSSMGNDDKSSIAGSEDADPPAPPLKPIKQVTRNKAPQEPPVKKGRRSRRCGQCSGCQVPDDCGVCTNCLDKPKFGGRNIKKQCCKMRKCQNLQWMPSKAFLQKQAKAAKRKEKKTRMAEKEGATVKPTQEPVPKTVVAPITTATSPVSEEAPLTPPPPPKKSDPPKKVVEEKPEEESPPALTDEVKQPPTVRKVSKQLHPQPPVTQIPRQTSPPPTPSRKEVPRPASLEPRKKQPFVLPETGSEQNKQKKLASRLGVLPRSRSKEKEKPLAPSKPDVNFNLLNTLCNGNSSRQKPPSDGVHRIRVDFKEDCEMGNVWEMGGLSILTTVPITPRVVCFLCASSGNVDFVFCQVCCEPFHRFCLEEKERPSEDQLENWCCRNCKFCHVCGRQQQVNKQLLECNKCRNSYHPECLGPNYPTKPTKKKRVWICTKCVRCKSSGSTTPGKGWDAQWSHDFSLCHDCSKLYSKGNYCPLCNKCYDDDDYESKMMQCGKCDRWVHSKCESLTDEMYEILSNLPESVAYTCVKCTDHHPAEWRLALTKELQASLKHVLTALLNSRTSSHLLRYRQSAKPPDLNPEPEENMPSRSSPEGPDPPVLIQVGKQDDPAPLDLDGVKKKMDVGRYTSVLEMSDDIVRIIQAAMNADGGQPELKKANSMVKSFFTKQMERVFPWFSVKKSRFWEPNKVASNSCILPNAVLPPSLDHNYAQWQERENSLAVQPSLMKKIIPAPKPKSPGDPESPPPTHYPPPATDHSRDENADLPPPPGVEDNRQCALCLKYGDDHANDAGRLLYIGQDEWTHINCALWSAEVFEDDDGSLKNVHMAVIRGKQLRCEHCQKLGATVGCCLTSCTSNYHFMCSRIKNCVFLEDKKVYCQKHRDLIKGEVVSDNNFEVFRRVVVDFEGINLRRKFLNGLEPDSIHMMIGSMTVDCLGILSDLSDCEEKLFPIGYQCSRVYWSTTDARKRCVYTCKILECRPPPTETDVNSTEHHEENRTIAHSPPHDEMHEPSAQRIRPVDTISLPSPEPLSSASSTWATSRPSGVGRVRTHRYRSNQRFPGPRPLPSAGSPVAHEIVTVGDPVLSSGLRSIGSRRHSSSSVSPQPPKPCVISPSHAEGSRLTVSQPDTTAALADHRSTNIDSGGIHSNSVNQSSCLSSNGHRIAGAKVDKPSETRRAGSLEILSKIPKTDKMKSLSLRSSDFAANQASTKVPTQPQGISNPDSSTSRAGSVKDGSVKDGSKANACHQHQRAIKRENDPNVDTIQAERTLSSENTQETHLPLGNHGVTVTKERRPKSKNQIMESSKEKHSSKSTTNDNDHVSGECRSQVDTNGNHLISDTGCFKMHSHSKNVDKSASSTESPLVDASMVSPCKAIKPKMAAENTSDIKMDQQTGSPPELTEVTKSQDSPEDTDDSVANHRSPNTDSEPQAGNAYPAQDSSVLLQDGSKAQEDSSYKRRYPRRSARARSNMFFGLTPLYGVRSYGEEDLPFCSSTPGKKRGKRSAEGQVDGADDLSSSEDDDVYYYNFSRTVVSAAADDRLGVRNLFRDDDRNLHRIPQLDGVDDGTESDASITTTTGKSGHTGKRSSKQNGAEKLVASNEPLEKSHTGKGSKGSDTKIESCHPVKQDSLETQLSLDNPRRSHGGSDKTLLDSFNTELLKSDSDNNNSDDCGNILPIDIMDFVLKNTPAMQALGESPESSSSELLTLGDGLGLDTNRGKDMGLFEVFSQQLPSSDSGDGTVPSSMSAEEQFELPLELPSDLSVLTTRSPSLPSQNHSRLGVIPDSQMSAPSDRSLLSLPTPDTGEKRVSVTEKPVTSGEGDSDLLVQSVDRTPERHMTPDRFITGHMEAEHISSPSCGQVDHGSGQELTRNSSTPNLQVPVSPTVPIQNQKYIPSTTESPGPSQMQNTAIQSTSPHLKSTTEKVVVVNQNMQPLYVLQTLPNGVTQKIQLTQPVPSGSGRMDGDVPVLSSMGAGLTLATTLNPTLTSPFPSAAKGLLPISHHPHLQPFPTTPQAAFLPGLTNQPPGLLIGVQPTAEPQLLVSESGQRSDLSSASNPQTSGMGKKRQISRLHNKKNKKLAPSVAPALRHPPEVVSNMTLINFTAPQLAGSLPNHPSLIDLGSLGSAAPHRSIPNIIKRSKSGVMYFDQTPLLPQNLGASNSVGIMDHGHLTSQVPAIATGSSVLNVVSMQTTATPPPVSGHVTLTSQGILGPSELSSIGNFLIKTSPQGLGIQDNHVALPSGPGIFSSSPTAATLATTSSICVVPTSQSVGMTLAHTVNDQDCPFPISHHMNRLLSNRPPLLPDSGSSDHRSPTHQLLSDAEGKAMNSASGPQRVSSSAVQKTKSKGKRQTSSTDKTSRKKHKSSHSGHGSTGTREQDKDNKPSGVILSGSIKPKTDDINTSEPPNVIAAEKTVGQSPGVADMDPLKEQSQLELKSDDWKQPEDDVGFSSPLMRLLQHEQRRQDLLQGPKPRTGLLFEISSDDGFQISANSIEEAWKSLTDKVQEARSNARLKQLSFAGVNGLRMLGIIHDAVLFLVEQLYGANRCRSYKFRFHRPAGEEEPPINPHGSARAEVNQRKSAFDMFNFLASKHRQPPEYKPNDEEEEEVQLKSVRRATSMDLPMPMRFRHLKKTSKEAVGVYRSPIHGRGLFCKRNIDAGEMVIEYSGNVIRSTLTDKREKYYDGKGIGCYMFRIDDSEVVDATMHGNAARFINHSCEPNCYSRVIPIDGQKHIVIFAMRKIYRGEELTYDYKFPIEDASNKLACNCGTKKCRKFLN